MYRCEMPRTYWVQTCNNYCSKAYLPSEKRGKVSVIIFKHIYNYDIFVHCNLVT